LALGHYRISSKDMRLADFILRDMESILVEWEAFAATLFPAAASMTSLALRDHAKRILEAVAIDLSTRRRGIGTSTVGLQTQEHSCNAGAPRTAREHGLWSQNSCFQLIFFSLALA
jgi:hypothetical protein